MKLELAKILREISVAKSRHSAATRHIPWDTVKIEGYSTDELKLILKEIIKSAGVIRTLDEVLAHYEANHRKLNIASHPDHPKNRPKTATMSYVMLNRAKLTQQLQKQNPGKDVPWVSYEFFLFIHAVFIVLV